MPGVLHVSDSTRYKQPFPAEFKYLYHSVEMKLSCRLQSCLNKLKLECVSAQFVDKTTVSIQCWKEFMNLFNKIWTSLHYCGLHFCWTGQGVLFSMVPVVLNIVYKNKRIFMKIMKMKIKIIIKPGIPNVIQVSFMKPASPQ